MHGEKGAECECRGVLYACEEAQVGGAGEGHGGRLRWIDWTLPCRQTIRVKLDAKGAIENKKTSS